MYIDLEGPLSFDVGDLSAEDLQAQMRTAYPILVNLGRANALMNRWGRNTEEWKRAMSAWRQFLNSFYAKFYPDAETGPRALQSYFHGNQAELANYESLAHQWLAWAQTWAGSQANRVATR